MKSTYQQTLCPHCGKDNDMLASVGHRRAPTDGSFMLCTGCAQVAVYEGKSLRKPNVFEDALIKTHPELQRAIAALESAKNRQSAPVDPQYRELMQGVAHFLGGAFEGLGFALLVFEFDKPANVNYIGNAGREDMIAAMKEFIARHEGQYHAAPSSKQ